MKLLVLLSVLSWNLFASEVPILKYEVALSKNEIAEIQLFSDKTLHVKKFDVVSFQSETISTEVFDLKEESFSELMRAVYPLRHAKIEKRTSEIVCMVLPPVNWMYNRLYINQKENGLTLVDGPHGCWVYEHTHPASLRDDYQAQALKQTLKVLALELSR